MYVNICQYPTSDPVVHKQKSQCKGKSSSNSSDLSVGRAHLLGKGSNKERALLLCMWVYSHMQAYYCI